MKLTLPVKLAYWTGQVAEGLFSATLSVFLLFYYNQVLGVSGTITGLALATSLLVDAIVDPMVGAMSDRLHSRQADPDQGAGEVQDRER